ncbi:hypothetical protein [Phenylobacterium sp.]|nr:hypothetical protein [Phenylobacterium sp.]
MRAILMALAMSLASLAAFAPTTAAADDDEGPPVCEYLSENNYFCL